MRFFFLLVSLIALPLGSAASTVLLSHSGSANPTTQGWSRASTSNVVAGAYNDNGREVWRVYDAGLTTSANNLNYSGTLNAATVASVMDSGWELSATLRVPEDDPDHSIAMAAGSNIWIGFIINETDTNRRAWAFMFGRAENGDTLVSTYGSGTPRTLAPGYHDYSMVYDPATALVTVSIDGEFWKTYAGASSSSNGTQQVYWGDNSGQTSTQPGRAAYYESVQFASVPEPSRLLLLGLGIAILGFHRRRGNRAIHS
ncbi:PEP-CTERM sorting domain-containing protein [Prosthecobacter sp. SYSU 5D2]|uniref:PEP-CTERM sorting domain-containing protein n=1 Tax=Prosthecobacter sp. SYSU 5D2 TaxID=3134134 RepID=UPI0031FEF265